ncbi:MAG: coenzyme F420-0:L-glutamate ligase [Patescibacteria group bacterium]|nr:coenzyme F420-0:L-glutamate ligase [Patescibacteria group bacterium]
MRVSPIRTSPVTTQGDICTFLDSVLPRIEERSILVITSKIVSILEGRIAEKTIDKRTLVKQEADYYIEEEYLWNTYRLLITRKNDILIANSGIDESNANGKFILWPKDPFKTATTVWEYVRRSHALSSFGVIITDSRLTPLRWGTLGVGIAWCGFEPLNDYRGHPDIFGVPLKVTKAGVLDGLAAAAVLVMGEGKEQTPLALITDLPFVNFTNHPPRESERDAMRITPEDDIYAPLLVSDKWKKGK